MKETLYRRALPDDAIAFSSREGKTLFAEALASGAMEGYFRLAEQFHTQSDPAYCSLGSLVVALNALEIEPGRLWKGPWRWFSEELLDCCVPLEEVKKRGLTLDELACLARCNGAEVVARRATPDEADPAAFEAWSEALRAGARGEHVVIVGYDRARMDQTGSGHYSPIGGYHAGRDLVLVMDVARFKYPPHWVPARRLWSAMQSVDPSTNRPRGYLVVTRAHRDSGLAFSLGCGGESLFETARRLSVVLLGAAQPEDVAIAARSMGELVARLDVRDVGSALHQATVDRTRAELRALPLYAPVVAAVGAERAEAVALLLLVRGGGSLAPAGIADVDPSGALATEVAGLRAQLGALAGLANSPP